MYIEQGLTRPFYLGEERQHVANDSSNLAIVPNTPIWRLCGSSEARLYKSIKDTGILLVNEKLLIKFDGRLTALCISDFKTQNGSYFEEGFWYSPYDEDTKSQICSSFDQGVRKLECFERL